MGLMYLTENKKEILQFFKRKKDWLKLFINFQKTVISAAENEN